MKKLLAVLLAVMMVLSMSVMAFAADDTYTGKPDAEGAWVQTPEGDMNTDLYTLTTKYGETTSAEEYTVTIPATVEIPWEGTPSEAGGDTIDWSYSAHLAVGKTLTVGITTLEGKFADTEDKLSYQITENYTVTTDGAVVDTTSVQTPVTVIGWDDVAIGNYTANVTFTAAVNG